MSISYDPPAEAAIRALMNDHGRQPMADRLFRALHALNDDAREERFRRRSFAPIVDWGFVVRTRDEALLVLWDWDAKAGIPRVRYVGPDL